jgi:hypothetical protein
MSAITTTRAGSVSLAPQSWGEAMQFSEMMAKSDMVPAAFKGKPANIMVCVQWGAELGLGPLQALQNIAVINGRPTLWGDAALALVRGHPACMGVSEGVEGDGDARHGWCEVARKGERAQRRTFSVADAKKAGLYGKAGPWQQYPDRMMQLRARGFAIRDVFPDALRGVITAEEARDMPPEPREVQSTVVDEPRPAGDLRTYAQTLTQPGPAAEEGNPWPLITSNNERIDFKPSAWPVAVSRVLAKLESVIAVRTWQAAMNEHFDAIARDNTEVVTAAEEAITARIASFAGPDDEPGAGG